MNKKEIDRRIATIPAHVLAGAYSDLLGGNGGHTLTLEWAITRKQVNALFAWHSHYGRILPSNK